MKSVLITGATGFIAGSLAARCRAEGWRVAGTVHTDAQPAGFDALYRCALGESLAAVLAAERVDAVVHAANFAGPGEYEVNYAGTSRWHDEARGDSTLQILLSSLSAGVALPSDYGRAKRDLEARFLPAGGVVLRLGLVAGAGGVFGRMISSVRRSPLLPLVDGGRTPVFLVSPAFLMEFLVACIRGGGDQRRGAVWHLHQPGAFALREILAAIRRHTGSSCRFVSVPSALLLGPVAALERLGLRRLPVSSSNIRGLRLAPNDVATDLARLGGREYSLEDLVTAALRGDTRAGGTP